MRRTAKRWMCMDPSDGDIAEGDVPHLTRADAERVKWYGEVVVRVEITWDDGRPESNDSAPSGAKEVERA